MNALEREAALRQPITDLLTVKRASQDGFYNAQLCAGSQQTNYTNLTRLEVERLIQDLRQRYPNLAVMQPIEHGTHWRRA